jgi:hypothetical protein
VNDLGPQRRVEPPCREHSPALRRTASKAVAMFSHSLRQVAHAEHQARRAADAWVARGRWMSFFVECLARSPTGLAKFVRARHVAAAMVKPPKLYKHIQRRIGGCIGCR